MRVLFACLFLVVALPASMGEAGTKLYGTFSAPGKDLKRESSFFELPRTVPTTDGWAMDESRLAKDGVVVYCRNNDYRVCLLYDKKGSIAGVQISIAVIDFLKTNAPKRAQLIKRKVAGVDVYSTTLYFVRPSVLKAGGRYLYPYTKTAPEGYFVPTPSGGFRQIPLTETEIQKTKYTKQGCIPNMGRHYFYDVNKQLKCEDMEIFFGLYNDQTHELVGGGMVTFVESSPPTRGRVWLEAPPKPIIKVITPDAPECATVWANRHGLASFHVYTTDAPWTLTCSGP